MKWIIAFLITVCGGTAFAQIDVVEDFVNEHPSLKDFYIYQSTLRMLNQDGDSDFNKLIRDIRKINVYISQEEEGVTHDSYQRLVDRLKSDSFETLVQVKYENTFIDFMTKDIGKRPYYVLALHDTDGFGLMEMDGFLDLQYLTAIENIDFSKLEELVMDREE